MGREGVYAPPDQQQTHVYPAARAMRPGGGFGFGGGGYGRRAGGPTETRPFFVTSEFFGTLLAIVAISITAAAMPNLDTPLTWILIAAMVFGYVVSRGLAKAATKSYVSDPRHELLDGDSQQQQQQQGGAQGGMPMHGQPYGPLGVFGHMLGGAGTGSFETSPFFVTSEFVATVLAIIAVSITAASLPNLDAPLTWILIAAMVFTYTLSRGIAKAGTRSHAFDPRDRLLGGAQGGGQQAQGDGGAAYGTETSPFFITSEFVGALLTIVAIAITAGVMRNFDARLAWILITAVVCGYVLSRGLAKIGTHSRATDPRDHLLQRAGQGSSQEQHAHVQ